MSDVQRTGPEAPSLLVEAGGHSSAGEQGILRVHARNVTTTTQRLSVIVLGLEPSWTGPPIVNPAVAPDQTVTFEIPVTAVPGAAPGDYPFAVAVEAVPTGTTEAVTPARSVSQAVWRVNRGTELVMSLEPAEGRGALRGKAQVVIASSSDSSGHVELHASAEPGVRIKLELDRVAVGPQETVRVGVRLRASRPRVVGHGSRHSYRVSATGSQAPATVQGGFYQRPMFSGAFLRTVGIIVAICLWIGAAIVGLPWLSDQFKQSQSQTTGQTSTTAEDAADKDAAGKDAAGTDAAGKDPADADADGATGGSAGGSKGSTGGDAGDDPATKADLVRLAGSISGSAPQGVTVKVSPVAAGTADDLVAAGDPAGSRSTGAASLAALWRKSDDPAPSHKTMARNVPVQSPAAASTARTTRTGKDGTWSFEQMPATTRYLVVLSKPGYQTQRFILTGNQLAENPLAAELVPGRGTLRGTVRGPGGKAGGVQITVSNSTQEVTTRTATSGDVGAWTVDGLSTPGTYLLTAAEPGLGTQSRLVTLGAASSDTVDMTLTRGEATLAGEVTGQLVSGETGGLGGLTVTATSGEITRTATTTTGHGAGGFVLPGLQVPATYTVTIEGDGYLPQARTVELTTKTAGRRLSFQASLKGGVATGSVTNAKGEGLPGVGLILSNQEQTYKTMSSSDGGGTYRFTGVAAGTYVLSGQTFGYRAEFVEVVVQDGRTTVTDLTLAEIKDGGLTADSYIRGRAVDAATGGSITCPTVPASECKVTVSASIVQPDGTSETRTATQNPDDRYTLGEGPDKASGGLYPGRYQLFFNAPGYEQTSVSVQVAMNSIVEAATAALQPSPSISGSVQTRVGSVPKDTCVIARRDGTLLTGAVNCVQTTGPCVVHDAAVPASGDYPARTAGPVPDAYCALTDGGAYEIRRLKAGTYQLGVMTPTSSEYISQVEDVTTTIGPGDLRRYDPVIDRRGRVNITALASLNGVTEAAALATVEAFADGDLTKTPEVSVIAGSNGYAELHNLEGTDYSIRVTAANPVRTGLLTGVKVERNQELVLPVVASGGVADFAIKVVTQLSPAADTEVGQAQVFLTGVIGFNGMVPHRDTKDASTDGDGVLLVCAAAPCGGGSGLVLPLQDTRVDIRVEKAGYETYTQANVLISELSTIVLRPSGRVFTGSLELSGEHSATLDDLFEQAQVVIESAPPGAGTLSVGISTEDDGATRSLVWSDSTQPINTGSGGGRLIRPGTYKLSVNLPGYDSTPKTLVVPVAPGAVPAADLKLSKFGALRVIARDNGEPVEDTVHVITLLDGTTKRVEAEQDADHVDFGLLPKGTYRVVVHAAGYQSKIENIAVTSASTTFTAQLVKLNSFAGQVVTRLSDTWTRPLAGATVTASETRPSGDSFSTTSSPAGSYRVTGTIAKQGLVAGAWKVGATAAGHDGVSGHEAAWTFAGLGEQKNVNLELQPRKATLRLNIIDGAGVPIPGLDARLEYADLTNKENSRAKCTPTGLVAGQTLPGDMSCPDGLYFFAEVMPLTYTLSISGQGYMPLTTTLTIEPGDNATVTIPLSRPGGSIQGTVTRQDGANTEASSGATVTISPCPADLDCVRTTDSEGYYTILDLPSASYVVHAEKGGLVATRNVELAPAQARVVDLTLVAPTAGVPVTLTSANGFDLTGALVTLTRGSTTLGPQPVMRDSGSTYKTSFTQVPYGNNWVMTVTGPASHLGTYRSGALVIDSPQAAQSMEIRETQVRINVQGPSGAPASIGAEVGPASDRRAVTLPVGDQTVIYVSAGQASSVTVVEAGGWDTQVVGGTIASGTTTRAVTINLQQATKTTITGPGTALVGDAFDVEATVEAAGSGIANVPITVEVNRGSGWSVVATPTSNGSGSATVSVPGSSSAGAISVRASFAGSAAYKASQSVAATVTISSRPTASTLQWDLATRVLTAEVAVDDGHGALVIERSAGAAWVAVASSTSYTGDKIVTTFAVEPAVSGEFRARFVPTGAYYAPSTSPTRTAAADPSP